MSELGKTMITLGLLLVLAGVMVTFGARLPWLGKLPGDIMIKKESFNLYMPLTTSLLVSLVLSLFFWLFRR